MNNHTPLQMTKFDVLEEGVELRCSFQWGTELSRFICPMGSNLQVLSCPRNATLYA